MSDQNNNIGIETSNAGVVDQAGGNGVGAPASQPTENQGQETSPMSQQLFGDQNQNQMSQRKINSMMADNKRMAQEIANLTGRLNEYQTQAPSQSQPVAQNSDVEGNQAPIIKKDEALQRVAILENQIKENERQGHLQAAENGVRDALRGKTIVDGKTDQAVREIMRNIQVGDDGKAIIVDDNGDSIYDIDPATNGKAVNRTLSKHVNVWWDANQHFAGTTPGVEQKQVPQNNMFGQARPANQSGGDIRLGPQQDQVSIADILSGRVNPAQ